MHKQLIEVLNNVNQQLTDVQKTVVTTLLSLQRGQLNLDQENEELLRQLFEAAVPSLSLMALNMRQRVAIVTGNANKLATQANESAPSLAEVQQRHDAVKFDTRSLTHELREATGQPTPPMSAARQRIADIAQGLAEGMLGEKLGPDFAKGLQAHRAEQAKSAMQTDMPTLTSTAPTKVEPSAEVLKRQNEQAEHENLVKMICGENGLLAVWFSSDVYGGGQGPLKPIAGVNHYMEDILMLPYERLLTWPEGFYRNASSSAFQYLVKTNDVIGVMDFGYLVSDNTARQQQALQLIFHGDSAKPKRKLPFTHLENSLMKTVIRDINTRLSAIHKQ